MTSADLIATVEAGLAGLERLRFVSHGPVSDEDEIKAATLLPELRSSVEFRLQETLAVASGAVTASQ